MAELKVVHNTFVIEKQFTRPAAEVFDAISDPEKARKWHSDERSSEIISYEHDFREGGFERMVYKMGAATPIPGMTLENEGRFQEIVPGERVVVASTMSLGGRRISVTQSTFELLPEGEGTKLVFTHQGAFLPGADGPEMRRQGWETLLERVAKVVEG